MRFADLLYRLRALVRRHTVEQELDDELRDHLEREIARQTRAGVPHAEALRRARLTLGGVEQVKEECREARGTRWIDEAAIDLRYACRLLRRSPGFAAMAIVSLALGIGANTAIFTLIDAVMFRALPVRAPDALVSVGDASRPNAMWEGGPMLDVLSYPLYERLRDRNRVFTGLMASGRAGRVEMRTPASDRGDRGDGRDGTVDEVRGRLVSGNYFDVLGVTPALGRAFSAADDLTPGAHPIVVISHDCWQRRFSRDAGILGRAVVLNGAPFTIIGVGPRGFTGEVVGSPTEIWIPLGMQAQLNPGHARLDRRDANWLLAMGRLRPGVSLDTARAELTLLAHEALADYAGAAHAGVDHAGAGSAGAAPTPDALREIRGRRLPVDAGGKGFSWVRRQMSPLLWMLMGVVGLVLIIACANVANLLLARATSRQREISVRLAMGARRWRLVRQLLTEGAVLAAIGGGAGLLLAGWGSRALSGLASRGGPNPVPFDVDVRPDAVILAFTAGVSMLTALLFGLAPALRSTRVDLAPTLKGHARSLDRGGWPWGRLLVIGQLALSVPLLVGAGLFVRSLAHLQTLDVGYSRDQLLLMRVDLAGSGEAMGPQRQSVFVRALMERLAAVPGVAGVTVSENGLFSGTDSGTDAIQIDGVQPARSGDSSGSFDQVGPRYFRVVGLPILAGREFDERDIAAAPPAAILNETMARFYFGTDDPLGKTIRNGSDRYLIVGVVKDSRQRTLRGRTERRFYLPLSQSTDRLAVLNVAIRTRGEASRLIPAIRGELQAFGRGLKVPSLEPVRSLMDHSLTEERMIAQLSGFFGLLALLLAAAGLYGVMSYAISRRTNEIGLRMALGAGRRDVLRLILRETLLLIAGGFVIGLPAALIAARLIAATLEGVGPGDPATIAAATLVLLTIGLLAGFVPARRASRIDPMAALRRE